MKFTPGPWDISHKTYENEDGTQSADWIEVWSHKEAVAWLGDNREGDAKLIAKAPEMYQLLKELSSQYYSVAPTWKVYDIIRAANDLLKEIEGGDTSVRE
jgi:hypothetical protein